MSALGLESANRNQGIDVIPAGTLVVLVMKIKPGNVGIESLCKRTSKGDAEGLDTEYTVKGGEYDGRKLFNFMLLAGSTDGHGKAGEISRALLRAIYEAVHAIDPNDNSPATMASRASATLAEFNGATFLATVEVEKGGRRPDGGFYRDKNVIAKVLRVGDQGYRRLEQPPPSPIVRSASAALQPPAAVAMGEPAAAVAAIAKPKWATE
jgi:hypothetical protein